jgi:hypothetical protein
VRHLSDLCGRLQLRVKRSAVQIRPATMVQGGTGGATALGGGTGGLGRGSLSGMLLAAIVGDCMRMGQGFAR